MLAALHRAGLLPAATEAGAPAAEELDLMMGRPLGEGVALIAPAAHYIKSTSRGGRE